MRSEEEAADRAALLAGRQRATERVDDLLADTEVGSDGVTNTVPRQVTHGITVDYERDLVDIRWRAVTTRR
jgi:hypothetical protein